MTASSRSGVSAPPSLLRILLVEDNEAHTKLILRAFKEDRLAIELRDKERGMLTRSH